MTVKPMSAEHALSSAITDTNAPELLAAVARERLDILGLDARQTGLAAVQFMLGAYAALTMMGKHLSASQVEHAARTIVVDGWKTFVKDVLYKPAECRCMSGEWPTYDAAEDAALAAAKDAEVTDHSRMIVDLPPMATQPMPKAPEGAWAPTQ